MFALPTNKQVLLSLARQERSLELMVCAPLTGGVAVGIYTTNNPEACQYITEHSEAEVVVVENKKQLEKFVDISKDLPKLKALVIWEGGADGATANCTIYTWADFMKLGASVPDSAIRARIDGRFGMMGESYTIGCIFSFGRGY